MSRRIPSALALAFGAALTLTACSGGAAQPGSTSDAGDDFGLVTGGTLTVATEGTYRPFSFHDASGEGYRLLADAVIALDPINASTAARLVSPLGLWRRQAPPLAAAMRRELERVLETPNLSKGTFEKASKGLA